MKRKLVKKAIHLLLCLALISGGFFTATTDIFAVVHEVARVNNVPFSNLDDAVQSAEDTGGEIWLTYSVILNFDINSPVIINTYGYNITVSGDVTVTEATIYSEDNVGTHIRVQDGASLTLGSGATVEKNFKVMRADEKAAIEVIGGGTLILDGGTIYSEAAGVSVKSSYPERYGPATCEVRSGNIDIDSDGYAIVAEGNGVVNISGGTVKGSSNLIDAGDSTNVFNISGGIIRNAGTLLGGTKDTILTSGASINITGGDIISDQGRAIVGDSSIGEGSINISGGTVKGLNEEIWSDAGEKKVAQLTGGLFAHPIQDLYIAPGYEMVTEGAMYTVTSVSAISINTPADKLAYKVGEDLDVTGLTIDVNYVNGTSSAVPVEVTPEMITGFDSSEEADSQSITINYGHRTASYSINVEHDVDTDWTYDSETHWHACLSPCHPSLKYDEAVHDWDEGIITLEPTNSTAGEKLYTCSICAATKTEVIPKLTVEKPHRGSVVTNPADENLTVETPDGKTPADVDGSGNIAANRYKDISENQWYNEYVEKVVDKGIMKGISDNLFAPGMNLSRAMMVQILYNLEGQPAVSAGAEFSDVTPDAWYRDAVLWAAQNGLVLGVTEDTYNPNADLTREQMVVILARYEAFKNGVANESDSALSFADSGDVSAYAVDSLKWACEKGIINGMEGNLIMPKAGASRAQIAAVFTRYLGL